MSETINKSVLIAGGSGGIGGAAARQLAAKQWNVFIGFNKNRSGAEAIASEINRSAGKELAWAVALPMKEAADTASALDFVQKTAGGLDALLLSASPAPKIVSFLKTESSDMKDQLTVNGAAAQALIAAVWKRFFQTKNGGHVVAVSSKAIEAPVWPHMSAYVAGKKALESLLESALAELGASGLRATTVRLGYTETPMLTSVHPHMLDAARAKAPGGKFLPAEDAGAALAKWIADVPSTSELRVCRLG